jgi:hypothetical protein
MSKKLFPFSIFAASAALAATLVAGCASNKSAQPNSLDRALFTFQTNNIPVVTATTNAAGAVTLLTNNVPVVTLGDLKPAVKDTVTTGGAIAGLYTPWAGFGTAGLLGLLAIYREARNRNTSAALVQGLETARQLLSTTDQGKELLAKYNAWAVDHQRELGVIMQVGSLVDKYADPDAARGVVQTLTAP